MEIPPMNTLLLMRKLRFIKCSSIHLGIFSFQVIYHCYFILHVYIFTVITHKYFDCHWIGMTSSFCLGNTGLPRILMLGTEVCWQHMTLKCQTWVSPHILIFINIFIFVNINLALKLSSKKRQFYVGYPATVAQIISSCYTPPLK